VLLGELLDRLSASWHVRRRAHGSNPSALAGPRLAMPSRS